jgi:hypothetical protein
LAADTSHGEEEMEELVGSSRFGEKGRNAGGAMRSLESFEELQVVPTDSRPIVFSPELYVRSRGASSRLVAGETLVQPVSGHIGELASVYTLNETATTIWEALEKPRSLREICDLLEHNYDISMEKAEEEDVEIGLPLITKSWGSRPLPIFAAI